MATTPNYGWVTPAPTDFVTDLPADFETFADAVDASFAADEGDLLVGNNSNIFVPLAVGTNGQVLTSNGTTPTWATPATPQDNWTLLNTGGTALTGSATITVSGLNKDKLLIIIQEGGGSATGTVYIRFNTDSGNNYYYVGNGFSSASTYADTNSQGFANYPQTGIIPASLSTNTNSRTSAYLFVQGAQSTNKKVFHGAGGATEAAGTDHYQGTLGGFYDSASTISSVTAFKSGGGSWNAGTLWIYGA